MEDNQASGLWKDDLFLLYNDDMVLKNAQLIKEIAEDFVDLPYFVLPPSFQKKRLTRLRFLFKSMRSAFPQDEKRTQIYIKVEEINRCFSEIPLDEHKLFSSLKDLIYILRRFGQLSPLYDEMETVINKVIDRAKPFWISESAIAKYNQNDSSIWQHSKSVLFSEMQLYSLDYFLLMYKKMSEGDTSLILNEFEGLPSLMGDALDDDMLKKVVYNLREKKLRYQMIRSYYDYKKSFLSIEPKKVLTSQDFLNIKKSLQKYCLSLLVVSDKYGIEKINSGIHFPYGSGVLVKDIINIVKRS